jgi:metal-responsive CopG/Arc/MetJ family transcriptional regulator
MRTLVDLGEIQLQALDAIARARKGSRAALIRAAVDAFLAHNRTVSLEDGFGLWADKGEDGLAYQERLRSEW